MDSSIRYCSKTIEMICGRHFEQRTVLKIVHCVTLSRVAEFVRCKKLKGRFQITKAYVAASL